MTWGRWLEAMEISTDREEGTLCIRESGLMDGASTRESAEELETVIGVDGRAVIVDFEHVSGCRQCRASRRPHDCQDSGNAIQHARFARDRMPSGRFSR